MGVAKRGDEKHSSFLDARLLAALRQAFKAALLMRHKAMLAPCS